MTKVVWGAFGDRFYETGVDRGVLYTDGSPGRPWDGLVSIEESAVGGEARAFYLDGEKYINVSSDKEFKMTLEAYSSPPEFDFCDGSAFIRVGLFGTQQKRKEFGLCYRTMIGNDTDGTDYGYKIHIIYNALAVPSNKTRKSIGSSADPETFTWDITTRNAVFPGVKNTSHLVIDASKAYDWAITALENILYGTDIEDPRLPTPTEIVNLFEDNSILQITDNGDGTWTAEGPDSVIQMLSSTEFQIDWPSAIYVSEDTYTLQSL